MEKIKFFHSHNKFSIYMRNANQCLLMLIILRKTQFFNLTL